MPAAAAARRPWTWKEIGCALCDSTDTKGHSGADLRELVAASSAADGTALRWSALDSKS